MEFAEMEEQELVMCIKKDLFQNKKENPKALYSCFSYAYIQNYYSAQRPKFAKNSVRTNQKGLKKMWVPKDKIIYVAYLFSGIIKTSFMVLGLWLLITHDRKKEYVPRCGT